MELILRVRGSKELYNLKVTLARWDDDLMDLGNLSG